jgi:hypothetical protein
MRRVLPITNSRLTTSAQQRSENENDWIEVHNTFAIGIEAFCRLNCTNFMSLSRKTTHFLT